MYQSLKTVTFWKNCCSIIRVFSLKSVWNLTFCSFLVQKPVKKTRCTWHKKPLRFVKFVLLLYWLFPKNWSEISRFVLLLTKKHPKNKMYLSCKTVTFWKNCPSIIRGFAWKPAWNLTSCSLFTINRLKKDAVPIIKYRYVLWILSFYYIDFSLKIGFKSHLLLFHWQKKI